MSDEWRLRVDLHEDGPARALTEHLGDSILEHDLDTSFDGLVVVSREGPGVFCYTGTRQQAQKAEMLIHSLAADQGWHVDAELTRWHPSAEEWEEPDKPLPQGDLEHAAESPALVAREHGCVEEHRRPEFGVGMQCASHRQALQLIETLRKEGVPSVRRSKYIPGRRVQREKCPRRDRAAASRGAAGEHRHHRRSRATPLGPAVRQPLCSSRQHVVGRHEQATEEEFDGTTCACPEQ